MSGHLAGRFCAFFLLLTLGATAADAAANRWTNALGGNWNVAGNWSGGIPTATDTAVIDLNGTYTVTMNVNPTIAALRISGSTSGVQTVSGSARTIALPNASSIGAQGVLALTGTNTISGAGAITNEGTLQIAAGTVAQALSNSGTFVAGAGTLTLNGAFSNALGAMLRVQSTASGATLNVANGFTNNGAIELTSFGGAGTANITVTTGTLTNAALATISTLVGAGGARQINAQLSNAGTVTIGANTTTSVANADHANTGTIDIIGGNYTVTLSGTTPTFTMTSGAVNVASGRTFNMNAAAAAGMFYNYNGGTLGGAGTVSLNTSTLVLNAALATSSALLDPNSAVINGPSTLTISTGTTVTATSSTINAPVVAQSGATLNLSASDLLGTLNNSGTVTATGASTGSGNYTTQTGSVIRVFAGTFTLATGFTNTAAIELTALSGATTANLTVTWPGTLTNSGTGTISALVGTGGARQLNAQLNNAGTITVSQNLTTSVANADHVNTGTIDVTGGNYTVTLSGTTPTFTMTSGAINVASGRTLNLNAAAAAGQFYNYNGGTLGGAGTVSLNTSTLVLNAPLATSSALLDPNSAVINGPSALTVSTGTTLTATSTTINAPVVVQSSATLNLVSSDLLGTLNNSGTVTATGASTGSGNYTTQTGSVIRVFAGTFTLATGFTNTAAIELTALSGATTANLTVTYPGTLTNSASGTISALVGTAGARQLNAQLNNAGTITVLQNLTTSVANADHVNTGTIDITGGNYTVTLSGTTPSFTMSGGAINVASTRTFNMNAAATANMLYNFNGGTLGGAGTVSVNTSTLVLNQNMSTASTNLDPGSCVINGPSVLTVSTGTTLTPVSSTINAPVGIETGGTLDLNTSSLNGSIVSGGVLQGRGFCPIGSLSITTSSVIRALGTASATGWLQFATGFVNDETIELTSNAVNADARIDVTTGQLFNTTFATINALVGAGGTSAGRILNANLKNVGTVNVAQNMTTLTTPGNHFNTGTINLTTGNWTCTMGGTSGLFDNGGNFVIPVGRTLALNGAVHTGTGINYNLNSGTNVSGGGILSVTNSTLKLNVPYSTSFADLVANGATINGDTLRITVGDSAHVVDTTTVNAPLVVEAGGKFSMNQCFLVGAARSAGLVEVINFCQVNGPFTSLGGSSMVLPGISTATSRLRFANGFTNNGVLDMTSRVVAGTAILETTAGTITNSPTGTINVENAFGGARQILAPFSNAGQLNVHLNLTVSEAGAAFDNSGTIAIDATRTMTVTGASFTNLPTGAIRGSGTLTLNLTSGTLVQQGKIAPGASPGALTILRGGVPTVAVPFAATSSLDVEVGGDVAGTGYDQLILDGPVTLNGALNISVINGYQPQPGRRYVVATFKGRTGSFSSITGLDYNVGQMWAVAYSDTDVVLLAMDQTWSRALPDGAPPAARDGHAAAYDPTGDRMMVFGGQTDASVMNDTWVLSKAIGFNYPAWTQLATAGAAPSQRRDATAVYAAASNRLIVFGGTDAAGTATFGDVRVLTNANGVGGTPTWSLLSPTGTPPSARSGHAAAYDAANDRMIVMGGDSAPSSCGGELGDVWVLSNASGASGTPAWTQLAPTGVLPTVRAHHGASYDAATGRLIVTGGDACGVANMETWTLSNANGLGPTPAWTQLAPTQPAAANWSLARYAYDDSYGWLDAFGGKVGATLVDTAFTLTNAQGSGSPDWYRRLFYGSRPAPRSFHSMIMANATHTAVVFGGMTATGRTNDVWRRVLDKGPVLAVDPPVIVPMHTAFALPPSPNPARGAVSMAVDIAREQRVDLAVFDLAGRRVETIHSGPLPVGRHTFEWAGARSGRTAPGVYMVRMKAEDKTQILRIVQL